MRCVIVAAVLLLAACHQQSSSMDGYEQRSLDLATKMFISQGHPPAEAAKLARESVDRLEALHDDPAIQDAERHRQKDQADLHASFCKADSAMKGC